VTILLSLERMTTAPKKVSEPEYQFEGIPSADRWMM
jgi:hypothetical protein